jgi:TRAP-type mannitol/chloroaromatic compound transport system permease large subunit
VFVMFVLIGSTVFSLTFQGVDGPIWVEHLFAQVPGDQVGFLVVVNLMIFVLGFFLDFFEIAFILLPLLAPVAVKMDVDLVWFGIIVAMNLQTSFLTPPFGFALFYLRSVAPNADYDDRLTKQRITRISTGDIYRGSVAFVIIQLAMLAIVISFPALTLEALGPKQKYDLDSIRIEIPSDTPPGTGQDAMPFPMLPGMQQPGQPPGEAAPQQQDDDLGAQLLRRLNQ